MTDYIHKGSQALEFPGLGRVEPSAEGTPFSLELDPDQERSLVAAGLIEIVTAPEVEESGEAPQIARKGRR